VVFFLYFSPEFLNNLMEASLEVQSRFTPPYDLSADFLYKGFSPLWPFRFSTRWDDGPTPSLLPENMVGCHSFGDPLSVIPAYLSSFSRD